MIHIKGPKFYNKYNQYHNGAMLQSISTELPIQSKVGKIR